MAPPKLRQRSLKGLCQIKPYLDEINEQVEQPDFILHDPVQFMHAFDRKKDQEIAGFLAATMAWGRREIVNSKMENLLKRMEFQPFNFIRSYDQNEFYRLQSFKHRTFKPIDIHGILLGLKKIYSQYDDLEAFWSSCYNKAKEMNRPFLGLLHNQFFSLTTELANRTRKHLSNPEKGSTCKRLYMFLRWTIRKNSPVDTGIWNFMDPSELLIPYDIHVARQGKKYGLVSRKSNDWKAVNQLTETLKILNSDDPVRYDFVLFGLGALGYELPSKFVLNRV